MSIHEKALVRPLDPWFSVGNFSMVKKLSASLLETSKEKKVADYSANLLKRASIDPGLVWIGLGTFIFLIIVTVLVAV